MFLSVSKGVWLGTLGILVTAFVLLVFGGLMSQGVRIVWEERLASRRLLIYGLQRKSRKRRLIEWVLEKLLDKARL